MFRMFLAHGIWSTAAIGHDPRISLRVLAHGNFDDAGIIAPTLRRPLIYILLSGRMGTPHKLRRHLARRTPPWGLNLAYLYATLADIAY